MGELCGQREVYGTDYNDVLVCWSQQHIPFAHVQRNALDSPLDFPDAHFDLVYAASVFTHLLEENASAWAAEIGRILRPGGYAFASFHGPRYYDQLRAIDLEGYCRLVETGFHCVVHEPSSNPNEGLNHYAAFHTEECFLDLFEGFERLAVFRSAERGPSDFAAHQDIVVFRRSEGFDERGVARTNAFSAVRLREQLGKADETIEALQRDLARSRKPRRTPVELAKPGARRILADRSFNTLRRAYRRLRSP